MDCQITQEMLSKLPSAVTKEDVTRLVRMSPAVVRDIIYHPSAVLATSMQKLDPWLDGKRVTIVDITDTTMTYHARTSRTKKPVSMPLDAAASVLELRKAARPKISGATMRTLASHAEFALNTGEYEEYAVDLVNDPRGVMELAREVDAMDHQGSISETERAELFGALEDILEPLTKVLPKVNLHINKAAKRTGGAVSSSVHSMDVYMGIGERGNKSALEVLVHELYHVAVSYAMASKDPEASKYLDQVKEIRKELVTSTTDGDLLALMPEGAVLKDATALLDYMTDPVVGLEEFVAHARTNKAIKTRLSQLKGKKSLKTGSTLWDKLTYYVAKVLNRLYVYVNKVPDKDGLSHMTWLVTRIAGINEALLQNKKKTILYNMLKVFAPIEEGIKEYAGRLAARQRAKPLPTLKGMGRAYKAHYLFKLASRSLVDSKAKTLLNTHLSLGGLSALQAQNTIATLLRDMSESDAVQDVADRMSLLSGQVDQARETTALTRIMTLRGLFIEPITDEVSAKLSSVLLDTDMASLTGFYNGSELLDDRTYLQDVIAKETALLEKASASSKDFNYYNFQVKGLATYMTTGEGSIIQLLNADSIAKKVTGSGKKKTVSPELVAIIDRLASLHAVSKVPIDVGNVVSELYTTEPDGIANILAYSQGNASVTQATLFQGAGESLNILKGYRKEVFSKRLAGKVAPISARKALSRKGYVLQGALKQHASDRNTTPMGYYVSRSDVRQDLYRSGLRYVSNGSRGVSIKDNYTASGLLNSSVRASRDIAAIRKEAAAMIAEVEAGTYTEAGEHTKLMPVFTSEGTIIDFTYPMSKEDKHKFYHVDNDVFTAIGRTAASVYDKAASKTFNDTLMSKVVDDLEENYRPGRSVGKNNREYVVLAKDSPEKEIKDIWYLLPAETRTKYPEGLPVRRDLMHTYFGFRELDVTEAPLIRRMPEVAKHAVKVAEQLWKEVISITKADIIIRTPVVLLSNIVSGLALAVVSGHDYKEVVKLQLQGVKELRLFTANTQEMHRLKAKIDAGLGSKQDIRNANRIQNDLDTSSVKELVDEGFYTSILEELESGQSRGGLIADTLDSKLKDYPAFIGHGLDLLYLNNKTKVFQLMSQATQYSDFVARYAQYKLMVREGAQPAAAAKEVRDAYINYSKPSSRFVEWANQMGFVMFTKYFSGIQRAIKAHGKKHPLKVALALLGQEFIVGDVEDITDQSFLVKDLSNLFYNPYDNFMRAIIPTGAVAAVGIVN